MIDFFASWPHYADHLIPVYRALDKQAGKFFVAEHMSAYMQKQGITPVLMAEQRYYPLAYSNPLVVAAHVDLQTAYLEDHRRPIILMEHGPLNLAHNNPSYAGARGFRGRSSLMLAPNQLVYQRIHEVFPEREVPIVGTPMLDRWHAAFDKPHFVPEVPTVAIAFHWDGSRVAPEAGNAFPFYETQIRLLAKTNAFKLIAHGHPRNLDQLRPFYERCGIEIVPDFREMMDRADLLVNDSSSILYMFLVTGKPVVLLNAPWFRKDVNLGVRFWDHTDVGYQVDTPEQLPFAISMSLSKLEEHRPERELAVAELFPHLGYSAVMTAHIISKHIERIPHVS